MIPMIDPTRRDCLVSLATTAGALLSGSPGVAGSSAGKERLLTTRGIGDVTTPRFVRHDIGTAPSRLHEPSVGSDGNMWTSPLDGVLWRYHCPSGETERIDLKKLTGQSWRGLHLWPIAHGSQVLLCTPGRPRLWVWHRDTGRVTQHRFPHERPAVYGGHALPESNTILLYDTRHSAVLLWDVTRHSGELFPCPYKLRAELYMMFADPSRSTYWGSTWNGNDIVRFDLKQRRWTGHFRHPSPTARTVVGGRLFDGKTLYISNMFQGQIVPLDTITGQWGKPIPVPGHGKWFGYLSGGVLFGDHLYFDHSTWTGGKGSIDGKPHHFIGSWTVFDPAARKFSRLDFPTRPGEQLSHLQSDYAVAYRDNLFLVAVNRQAPRTAIVLRSTPLPGR
ncbi:MAG: hypothetical protein CMJ65_02160 [Planctomycetaceae bacterium]|nr:hypothetical protein [Planctomycetaceae bacterium]